MNFESRIKHIEQMMKINAPNFCACASDPKYAHTETIYYENGKPATSPDLTNHALPDICETCAKPIHKMQIIIDFVDSKIPKKTETK